MVVLGFAVHQSLGNPNLCSDLAIRITLQPMRSTSGAVTVTAVGKRVYSRILLDYMY